MSKQVATNIVHHHGRITRADRERLNGHRSFTLWFTGLSGSGKSSVAVALEEALFERGMRTYILDGDNVRFGLNKNLGFSPEDRTENIRRIAEAAKLFRDAGVITLIAAISPYRADRQQARDLGQPGDFVEIFVDCTVDVCESRDPKGLYKKARAGEIQGFTGVNAPYEAPENAEIHLHSDQQPVAECVEVILKYLDGKGYLSV